MQHLLQGIFYAKVQEGDIQMLTPGSWFSVPTPHCEKKKLAILQSGCITMACLPNHTHPLLPHYLLHQKLLDSHNLVTLVHILPRLLLAWRSHPGGTMESLGGNLRNCLVQTAPRYHPSEPLGHRCHSLVLVLNSLGNCMQ